MTEADNQDELDRENAAVERDAEAARRTRRPASPRDAVALRSDLMLFMARGSLPSAGLLCAFVSDWLWSKAG